MLFTPYQAMALDALESGTWDDLITSVSVLWNSKTPLALIYALFSNPDVVSRPRIPVLVICLAANAWIQEAYTLVIELFGTESNMRGRQYHEPRLNVLELKKRSGPSHDVL